MIVEGEGVRGWGWGEFTKTDASYFNVSLIVEGEGVRGGGGEFTKTDASYFNVSLIVEGEGVRGVGGGNSQRQMRVILMFH